MAREFCLHISDPVDGPRSARAFLSDALIQWGVEQYADRAGLLVSELVTNAIVHGDRPIELRVGILDTVLHVEVTDGGARGPVVRRSTAAQPGGFGLRLVDSLADGWGSLPSAGPGKKVWFELRPR